jgi:hypothetical protein
MSQIVNGKQPKSVYILNVANALFFGYWSFAFIWYHCGLIEQPSLSSKFYTFFISCWVCYGVSCLLGAKTGDRTFKVRLRKRRNTEPGLLAAVSLLAAVGSLMLILDLLNGGATLTKTLTDTNVVRVENKTTLITTIASPLFGLQLYALAAYLYKRLYGYHISRMASFCVGFIILSRFLHSYLSANRQIVYFMFCWCLFYLGLRWIIRGVLPRLSTLVFGFILMTIGIGYIVFIAVKRNDESYLIATTKDLPLRYEVPSEIRESPTFAGLLQLDDYPSHVFRAIDRIVQQADYFHFDVSPIVLWSKTSIARIAGSSPIDSTGSSEYYVFMEQCDVSRSLWPSVFGDGAYSFGLVGFPIVLSLIGFLYGRWCRRLVAMGDFIAFYWLFVVYNYFIMGHMMIVGDVIMNLALFMGFLLLAIRESRKQRLTDTHVRVQV